MTIYNNGGISNIEICILLHYYTIFFFLSTRIYLETVKQELNKCKTALM